MQFLGRGFRILVRGGQTNGDCLRSIAFVRMSEYDLEDYDRTTIGRKRDQGTRDASGGQEDRTLPAGSAWKSPFAECGVLVVQRSEGLQRVSQLFDVLEFISATLAVVRYFAENPLRGILREFVAQDRFPIFNGPKHCSPLCFAVRIGTAG